MRQRDFSKKKPLLLHDPTSQRFGHEEHIMQALKQHDWPQSLIYGWLGLTMDPTMYAFIKLSPFVALPDPGKVPIYPGFATPQVLNTVEPLWDNLQNYYLSYINISRACFHMLDDNIPNQFKVSNDLSLIGGIQQ
jgi:hypothetical protein